jgi:hypothetical protein
MTRDGQASNEHRCHSDRDGDCAWDKCPQLRDMEPRSLVSSTVATGGTSNELRHCKAGGAMNEILVARCLDCPFCVVAEDDSEGECLHENTLIDVDIELQRPDWCPLNQDQITIKVGEP